MDYTKIRDIRIKRKWTQEELAEKAQVSTRTIRDLETGRNLHPSSVILQCVAEALFPKNSDGFYKVISVDKADYSLEVDILSTKKNIPLMMIGPLKRLIDPSAENTVSYVLACMASYLRSIDHNTDYPYTQKFLPSFGGALHTAQISTDSISLVSAWDGLISNIRDLLKLADFPDYAIADGTEIIRMLQHSHAANDNTKRLEAISSAYYWLQSNWSLISRIMSTYYALSNISVIVNNAADDTIARTQLFYRIIAYYDACTID